jgi:hypothetical protein
MLIARTISLTHREPSENLACYSVREASRATVNVDYLSSNVTCSWRGNEGDKHGKIFRLANIAGGTILGDPFSLSLLARQQFLVDLLRVQTARRD